MTEETRVTSAMPKGFGERKPPVEGFVRLKLVPRGDRDPHVPDFAYANCHVMVRHAEGADDATMVALASVALTDETGIPLDLVLRDHRLESEVMSAATHRYREVRATNGLFHLAAVDPRYVHDLDDRKALLALDEAPNPAP